MKKITPFWLQETPNFLSNFQAAEFEPNHSKSEFELDYSENDCWKRLFGYIMNGKRESASVENLSDSAEENWTLLFRHLRKKMEVDDIVHIDERVQSVFKPGQIFTKDLTNCKNPGEFRLKNNTIMVKVL